MREERWAISVAVLACLVVLLAWNVTIAEEESMPEEIVIDHSVYQPDRKGPVYFSHLAHYDDYDVVCEDCHHEYKGAENVWTEGDPVKKCETYHDPSESKGDIKKLRIAFHNNCKSCHENLFKANISEDAPYRNCYNCHERES
ncbi:MAG: cytochrome c3 family protein [Deltaproteobacteria bacterium]|nr:cytochrome c3 family protein [Deltaproteobacteria bacterium]